MQINTTTRKANSIACFAHNKIIAGIFRFSYQICLQLLQGIPAAPPSPSPPITLLRFKWAQSADWHCAVHFHSSFFFCEHMRRRLTEPRFGLVFGPPPPSFYQTFYLTKNITRVISFASIFNSRMQTAICLFLLFSHWTYYTF